MPSRSERLILADTSAWVELLRGTGSGTNARLRDLLEADELATTDVVLMELLAGALDDDHRDRLRGLLGRCEFLATEGPRDRDLDTIARHAPREIA